MSFNPTVLNTTDPQPLLSPAQAAARLGVSRSFLDKRRMSGRDGPPYVKLGRNVRYFQSTLLEWAASDLRSNTSQVGGRDAD